jgi:hypothetical protein
MMQKKFGQFSSLEDENPTGSQAKSGMPPITGSPMPNAGMKNKTMGSVFPAKDDPSVKQAAGRKAAAKRLKGLPNRSPLGPITGGPQKPKARPQQPQQQPGMQQRKQQQPSQDTGTGDQWMGELWQGLTLDEQPQGSFAMGGAVNPMESSPSMNMYNQVTRELESGGVSGYAHGGMVEQSKEIASKGRNGDTMLMHIQPGELEGLQSLLGPVTINPETGNPEAFAWFLALPLLAQMAVVAGGATAAGAGIGALSGGKEGAKKGAMMGLGIGATLATGGAASGALAAPTAAAVTAPTVASVGASAMPNLLAGGSMAVPGSVAPGIIGAGGAGAGTSFVAPATLSGITNSITPAAAGISKSGLANAAASGLSSLSSQGQQEQQAPMAPPPPTPAPSPLRDVPSPYARLKRRTGINSLPGSRSII